METDRLRIECVEVEVVEGVNAWTKCIDATTVAATPIIDRGNLIIQLLHTNFNCAKMERFSLPLRPTNRML